MKSQILILALLLASVSALTGTKCSCSEITVQADCGTGCAWVSINGSGTCQGATVSSTTPACSSLTFRSTCDAVQGCAWTTGTTTSCSAFTKCEDYTVKTEDANQCQQKDSTCIPGTVTSGTVVCKAGTLSCGDITDETVCKSNLYASSTSVCWWVSSKCVTQDVSKCSTITDSSLCDEANCVYANNACAAPTCASIKTETSCTSLRADEPSKVTICKWSGSACADLDAATLTQSTCSTGSYGTYAWNGSACNACSGSGSSNAMLLSLIGMLALLLF